MRHNQVVRAGKRTAAPVLRISNAFQRTAVLCVLMLATFGVGACTGLVNGTTSNPPSSTLTISNVGNTSTTISTSQIVWTTNVAADSVVNYGTSPSYGSSTPVNSAMVTNHQMVLSGLAPDTAYYYEVASTDSKGSHGKSGGYSFKTLGFSISGTITPVAGGSGAKLTLTGAANSTTTSDGSGNYTFTGLQNGTYTISPSHAGFTFTPNSQSIAINGADVTGANFTDTAAFSAPTITTQPVNQTVKVGQTASFSVVTTGTAPLSYQWNKNGTAISGATSSMYTTPATTSSDNGAQFTVVVSNSAGSVTSTAATLTVNAAAVAPTITTQPANQTVTVGQTASFTVAATGTAPLSYQWQKNGSNIAGAIGSSYTTPATIMADNNTTFDVIVSNAVGSVTSNLAALTTDSATACAATGSGVCYYVSPTGADSNSGTSSAPFLTIQQAANVVNPGDVVIIRDGTYRNSAVSGVGSKLIVMRRGGTAANHVVFIAEHKWGAKIDGLSNTTATGFEFSADYIDVKDFECYGFSDTCMENYNAGSSSGGQFISITGNNIHDIGRYCTTTTTGRDGIFISNDNVIIEGNQIHDIGRGAPGEVLSGVTCVDSVNTLHYQNNDHGIYVDGAFTSANNVTIKNNIFYRNERGWSIQVYPAAVNNLRILNNTFLCANPYRNGHITLAAPVTNSAIENNISWQPTTGFLQYDNTSGYSNLSVSNNLTYQGTIVAGTAPGGIALTGNLDNTDPMLVSAPGCAVDDPSVPNAYLRTASPAVDAGLTLSDVPIDYAGTSRPQGIRFDIGAFEYIF